MSVRASPISQPRRESEPYPKFVTIGGGLPRAPLSEGRILQFQATLLSHEKFAEAAVAFATDIASMLCFDRAVIGFATHGSAQIVATSHTAEFEPTELFNAFRAAMDEALDQGSTVVFPATERSRAVIMREHAEISRRYGGTVCTVPLVSHGKVFGAVTLVRADPAPPSEEEIAQCEYLACLAGPILELKYEVERPLGKRLSRSLRNSGRRLVEPGYAKMKVSAVAGFAVLLGILFSPVQYRIGAPARLEGSIQRALVAPADGFLRQVHARPGDSVKANQVVAELAAEDLHLAQRKWQSEHTQHENAAAAALARTDRTQFVISQAKAAEARAQLDLVDIQLSRINIVAPFDGLVIAGDLSQRLGAPVQRGEVLLTVAPANEFRLLIDVDERDITAVAAGQRGGVALGALSSRALEFEVKRVTPVATARDGRNFFEVEGKLEITPSLLRPGLQGVAKINVGERPLAWIWTHRLLDWLRLTLWSWGM